MKELRRNMRLIGIILAVLFVGAGVWYGVTVYEQGSVWASNVYNPRLAKTDSDRGDITDRNGVTLATTDDDGNRVYLSDESARRALS